MLTQKGTPEKEQLALHPPIPIDTSSKKFLRQSSEVLNPREESVKRSLLDLGIGSYYEYMAYPLSNSKAYLPDFITSLAFNGRQVVLEPHGSISVEYMSKLNEFIKTYGFYLILISNKPYKSLLSSNANPDYYIDQYWYIKDFENTEDKIPKNSKAVKKNLKKLLRSPESSIIKDSF